MRNNPEILFKNHLKMYVLLKDKIIFESELEKQSVEYYCYVENQPLLGNHIRYFIKDKDQKEIDNILIKNKIIAETEAIQTSDYRDGKMVIKMQIKIGGIVLIIMILILIVENLSK